MAKKKKREKLEQKPEWVEEIEYEKYCDDFVVIYKKSMFALDFGQGIFEPSKMFARIWLDPREIKRLNEFLQEQIKEYEKKHGKIEL